MTITRKLYLGFGIVLGLVFLMYLIGTISSRSINQERAQNQIKKSLDSIHIVRLLKTQMMKDRLNFSNYLLSGSLPDLNDLEKVRKNFMYLLKHANNIPT